LGNSPTRAEHGNDSDDEDDDNNDDDDALNVKSVLLVVMPSCSGTELLNNLGGVGSCWEAPLCVLVCASVSDNMGYCH
jgi:hypothetical protein